MMSPKEFHALLVEHEKGEERQDYRLAVFETIYCNSLQSEKKYVPDDFMPGGRKQVVMSDEQMEFALTTMFGVGPPKQIEAS